MLVKIGELELNLKLNIAAVKRIRERTGFDILAQSDPQQMLTALSDQMRVAEIIAVLLEPEFARLNIAPDQIYELFDGATLKAVSDAFFAEISAFFAGMGRVAAATALRKFHETLILMEQKQLEMVQKTVIDLDRLTTAGATSTAAPASPELIQTRLPSGNLDNSPLAPGNPTEN